MWRWTKHSLFFTILFCLVGLLPIQAQQNLLQNPGFESDYSGRTGRGDFNFPSGWDAWWSNAPHTEAWMNVPPNAYPHTGPFKRSGSNAQSIGKGGGTFTAAALQRVQNIPAGAVVRGSAWVFIENKEGTYAQVRIGIGSNVGTNVNGAITWSGWETALNTHRQISVEHVATGGEVTLFIYATQTWPNDPNAVYIDDAELLIVGQGEAPAEDDDDEDEDNSNTGSGGGNTTVLEPPSIPDSVAFVVPQDEDVDDGITHTVRSGDTLSSIAVAYGVPVSEILALNGMDRGSFLQVGQALIITTPEARQVEVTEEATPETTDEAESTTEVRGSIIRQPTQTPTEEATETPAESPTPTDTPTETPVPDTPTPAPTAPVAEANRQSGNPTQLEPGICIGMFDDDDQNGILDTGESYLADGIIVVNDSDGTEIESYLTDGESEPFCIEDLASGRYTVTGTAPDGYGLTTSPVLRISLEDGASVTVRFGAKEGLETLAIPTVDTSATEIPPETGEISDDQSDLTEFSGLIVFGLAGVVLVLGFGASLIMRRS